MKRALLMLSLAGCLPLPPEHIYDEPRAVSVAYKVLGPGDAPGSCRSGDNVTLFACVEDEAYECFKKTAPCTASGMLDVTVYTKGRWNSDDDTGQWDLTPTMFVYTSITDATGENEVTRTELQRTDLSSGDASLSVSMYPDAGFLRLGWQLTSTASGETVSTCGAVDVDEIELVYTAASGGGPKKVRWACDHRSSTDDESNNVGDGDTPALAPGAYSADVVAYRAGAEVARSTDNSFTIDDGGKIETDDVYLEISDR